MPLTPEQILQRIDRITAELQELRDAIAPERADELTEARRRELGELAERRVARLRRGIGGGR
jgi:hypothetical protein